MAEKPCNLLKNGGGMIPFYANPLTGDTGGTNGVSYQELTGIPKGIYILTSAQNVHNNDAASVSFSVFINNVVQPGGSAHTYAAGGWKQEVYTTVIGVEQDNSTIKVDFGKTVYQTFLRLYKIG